MAPHRFASAAAAAALLLCGGRASDVASELAADDQCASGDADCALNALQLRAKKTQAAVSAHQHEPDSCATPAMNYTLDMKAQGIDFFDQFVFVSVDDVHGAHQFTNRSEAEKQQVISAGSDGAQLKFGGRRAPSYDGEAWKRYAVNLHTNKAWDPQAGFLAVMHYSSMPQGCGLWPSFWAMNSDKLWPGGGELDILEFANKEKNKVTFHLGSKCSLDKVKVAACAKLLANQIGNDCETNYFVNKFGCMPDQKQPDGEYFANRPGVIAAEWTSEHITIYHIPEDEIPQDLSSDAPDTTKWLKWVLAYLPLEQGCQHSIGPQELVINMQLCGDWAGATFGKGKCESVSSEYRFGCELGLSQPTDCCTKYVTNPNQDTTMKAQVWDIKSVKVFTANGGTGIDSGTFKRGGVPLKE